MSINVPQEDPSVLRLKEAKDLAARLSITGMGVYQMERSFDVMEKAASNEGAGGAMAAMGAGLGVGFGVGNNVGGLVNNMLNPTASTPPPIPSCKLYHIAIGSQQIPNLSMEQIDAFIKQGRVNGETLVWTTGMPNWVPLSSVPELMQLVNSQTPPPILNNQ